MEKENKQQKISTPIAIIVAGVLIMVAILLVGNKGGVEVKEKTLSEQIGLSKEKLVECIKSINTDSLYSKIENSVNSAMKTVPEDERGTPYSVIIGSNNYKTEIKGARPIEEVRALINEVASENVSKPYLGEIAVREEGDHIYGNPNAKITIIGYSDFECPYCKIFHETLTQIVDESNEEVSWVFRHWPLHQNSVAKLIASECVATLKGNDAFWEYADLIFGLLETEKEPSVVDVL